MIRLFLALVSVILAACTPSSSVPPVASPEIRGVAYHGTWTSRTEADRAAILDRIAASGAGWVRLDVGWYELQPIGPDSYDEQAVEELDRQLREIADRGLSTLVMFWWAPEWSSGTAESSGIPGNPADYAAAAAWISARWPDLIDALEVWNEPNLPEFFDSSDAADYVPLLKATYPLVKEVRPEMPVISAAPANLDERWYTEFYAEHVVGFFDVLGAHPYPVIGDLPPQRCRSGPDTGCDLGWLVRFMAQHDSAGTPIWITEFGYSTHADSPALEDWQRGVTEREQASYTAWMLAYMGQYDQVQAAFVYRDRDFTSGDPHRDGFGILRYDNEPKPAFDVLDCSPSTRCLELAGGSGS